MGKEKLRTLDEGKNNRLTTQKRYINESLCTQHWKLLGKHNAPLKRKYISNFYSFNGKLNIKRGPADDRATDKKHEDHVQQIFKDEIINKINRWCDVRTEKSQTAEQSAEQ